MVNMEYNALKRFGIYIGIAAVMWFLIRSFLIWNISVSIWYLMAAFLWFPMFGFFDMWRASIRHQSGSFLFTPSHKYSASGNLSPVRTVKDTKGRLPPMHVAPIGGSNWTIVIPDRHLVIAPARSVEVFGEKKSIRLVHSPVSSLPTDAAETFFGQAVGIARKEAMLGPNSETYLSFINSLWGEDDDFRMQMVEEFFQEAISVVKPRKLVSQGEDEMLDLMKEQMMQLKGSYFARFHQRLRGFWKKR